MSIDDLPDEYFRDYVIDECESLIRQLTSDDGEEMIPPISDSEAPKYLDQISFDAIRKYIEDNGYLDYILEDLYEKGEIEFVDIDTDHHYKLQAKKEQIKIIYDELIKEAFIAGYITFEDFYYACTGFKKPDSYMGIKWIAPKIHVDFSLVDYFKMKKENGKLVVMYSV
ncbi:hypothetical protein DXA15_25035 [Parabacteroides sp. AM58-2XD]|uniref:hypothetical protein n=1 Tax=Parabacteroides sp. AM58-2XD TaxID=2292362 RepID=UPI000FE18D38|nr:hypothetical protein [Parabacteroides sp. AM58-2XD]RGY90316.1 hypothetical protein DXA15_25035 [Parabacteroides sp. AM58-2XD]